jgi:uncharacterized protein YeeX (DUF496 family)
MIPQTSSKEEQDDLKKRQELQSKLQEAIRRSASASEMRKIEQQIEDLNKRLDSYAVRVKRP